MTETDAQYRVDIGLRVKERLSRDSTVMKIPSNALDIFVARNFLGAKECERLMRLIDTDRIPSQLLAPTEDPEFRTSESCNLDPTDAFVQEIDAMIAGLLGIDQQLSEMIQGQRYAVGQQFKAHHDFFFPGEPYWEDMQRTGGQRTWTAMVFLNVPEGGGETEFKNAGIKVRPRAGNLLAWNNLDAKGEPNFYSLHQGCPVTAGVKYIITKWFRERVWAYTDMRTY
jgi:prolyl 4-hydroxylase